MKSLLIAISALLFTSASYASPATYQLQCWDTYNKKMQQPLIVANIESHNQLSKIEFPYLRLLKAWGITLKNHPTHLNSEEITSNHSPYTGNQRFIIKGSGELILPMDLSSANLKRKMKTGVDKSGRVDGENGVFITSYDEGDGAGSHRSFRLRCSSNI